ncbi:glycosyltransferase [Aureimonas altamirensis]|uniref:glycosyltransferase n=1 Tax=Aureimonas altamirensis TaxID=370622 RepID=UPI002556A74F|nr:glycosyltransferase [Aureimonas altamirensis]
MRNLLFVHNNFPAQFKHVGPLLAREGRYAVSALHKRPDLPDQALGMRLYSYTPVGGISAGVHPWLTQVENALNHGEAATRRALELRRAGFEPDVIIGHHGWGEMMFLRDIWPKARIGLYCELYYRHRDSSWDFDPEFLDTINPAAVCKARMLNIPFDLSFEGAVAGLSPTRWQANTFPESIRRRIDVVHDGIDTAQIRPSGSARLEVDGGVLTRENEVFTFVSRHLEPYRGLHIFMRALPALLRKRPAAHVVIVGSEGKEGGYGPLPESGTWKEKFIAEVRPQMDDAQWARVHFLGRIPYERFLQVLQVSTVHVYLTYPFVVSWSLLEAMSAGAAIVAGDTAPVREMVEDGHNGLLVDFFDSMALADTLARLATAPLQRARMGAAARQFVIDTYEVAHCARRQAEWIDRVAAG